MRIHSDTLTARDLYDATNAAGHRVSVEFTSHGSRSRDHAFNVTLTGTSSRRPNPGTRYGDRDTDDYAATWDEWGMFFEYLFNRDPEMLTTAYTSRADFDYRTNNRYAGMVPDAQHRNHKWVFAGIPGEQMCNKCDAIRRF